MKEIWKDVVGWEDCYQVSNLGNVRSKDRYVRYKDKGLRFVLGKMLKLKYDKKGYYIRDCMMVDAADIVLAVWDGNKWGGTWNTIEYALSKGKEVIFFPWK